ncbi:MAG: Mrp/NBP35 family ATP-binding protein [Anaerolineae bacterium]|nr:Mrp/NBP35 family ATP-binding protein [Anaerolineae bacterium]
MNQKDKQLDAVRAALGTVIEPELKRDLVTLNMVKDIEVEGGTAHMTVVLTTPACPLKDVIEADIRAAVTGVDGIDAVEVKWDARVPSDPRISGQIDLPIRNVIAVASGKGGVGKSTVAVNLAIALAQAGARVGLMDADILGPNIPQMIGLPAVPPPITEVGGRKKMIPPALHGVKVISMAFLVQPGQPIVWRGPMLHGAIRQFLTDVVWGELDYLVVDLPPGTGDAQMSLVQSVPVSGVVIVTQPQAVAVEEALKSMAMFGKMEVPILGIVENMSGEFFGSGGGEELAEGTGVPFLGRIPMVAAIREGGDAGKPAVAVAPDGEAGRAFASFAQQVAARVSVLTSQRLDAAE